jgi:DHA3 family macrolide efflux protein-like MFS transporter
VGGALRNRDFARLFFAGAASIGGFSIGQVAVNYLVFTKTHSSIDLAEVGVAFTVALVTFSLFAGTLADRQDRRAVMIVSDVVRAAALALGTLWLILIGFNLSLILAVSFILGSFSAIFQPAERAMTPTLLEKDMLPDANGLIQLTSSLAQAVSNALGGALVVAVGAILAIGLNSITFLVSALLIATLTIRKLREDPARNKSSAKRSSFVEDTREGAMYVWGNRPLLLLTISAGVGNLFFAMMMPYFVIYTTNILHGDATTYGLFLGVLSLGAVPGSLMVGRFDMVKRAGYVWTLFGVVGGVLLLALMLVPVPVLDFGAIFAFGVGLGIAMTTWLSIVQVIIPNEMQGRYFGIDQLGSVALLPVGQALGGIAIASYGLPWTFEFASGAFLLSGLVFLGFPSLRNLGYSGHAGSKRFTDPGSSSEDSGVLVS